MYFMWYLPYQLVITRISYINNVYSPLQLTLYPPSNASTLQDEEHIAFWNSVVRGEDTGDGWITTDIDEENLEFMEKMLGTW